jgi:hypothetical protein
MELGGWDYFWRIFLYSVPELMRDSLSCIGQSVAQSVSGVAANIFKTSFEDRWFHAVSCVFFLSILWKSLVTVGPQQRCFSPCPGAGCGACGETGRFEGDDMILEYCWGAYCRWRNSPRLFFVEANLVGDSKYVSLFGDKHGSTILQVFGIMIPND